VTAVARRQLGAEYLQAGMGISGCNFGIAESGTLVIVENEGNAGLSTSCPPVHVAILGIEKMLPRLEHLPVFLNLLGRSGTGQKLTTYTHLIHGPAPGRTMYVILLDNGRSNVLRDPAAVQRELAEQIGRPVFEIPTLPPSVPGTRLLNVLKGWLLRQGARVQIGHAVMRPVVEGKRVVGVAVASVGRETVFHADAVILATGGLYGGGLLSDDRGRIWEPIFDLPVQAQADRLAWFNADLLDPRGHPAHTFGIAVDECLRPLGKDGAPAYENLFAAGHILGGMDTLIGGCEEGFDLASAYTAVREALGND
jgi:hypothetical protein